MITTGITAGWTGPGRIEWREYGTAREKIMRSNRTQDTDGRGGAGDARCRTTPFPALSIPLTAVLALSVFACGSAPHREPVADQPALAAPVAPAGEVAWTRDLEVSAGVQPFRRATPGTVLMGRVERILLREGDMAKSGETLARIESRDVSARLAQAEAAVTAARAQEENARLMKERMERLYEKQAATKKNLDDATAGYEAAAAGLRAAEEGVKAARVYVGYSLVTAPFAGVITERHIEVGDMAAPGMPLFVIEDTSRMKVEAAVPESIVPRLSPGLPVEVEVSGAGRRDGTIREVLPAGDPRSRTFTVRVVLDNPDGALRSGAFARLTLRGEETTVLAVPETALVSRGPLTGVFVVGGDGRVRLRWITIGERRDGHAEVLTGLDTGERIVTQPPPGLEDGRLVEVG